MQIKSLNPDAAGARRGSGVVEILVAIMVFSVGALAYTATSAIVVRQLHHARAEIVGAGAVTSRLALLASGRCDAAAGGTVSHPAGVTESWSVSPAGPGSIAASVSITFAPSGRTRTFLSQVSCL
jgi:hypothetical protein